MTDDMNDESQDQSNGTEPPIEMDGGDLPPMAIGAQYIKDLSFENPQGPEILANMTETPQVNIEVNTSVRNLNENVYEVSLFIRGQAETDGKTVFIVELTYGGIVTLNNIPEESIQPVLLIEAPRHLFPFARAVVADVTRDGGFPPLMINPLDFVALYTDAQAEAEAESAAG